MELNYLSIGIKNVTINQVKTALAEFEFYNILEKIWGKAGIKITVEDLREDYLAMTKFLKENELKDENPFFNDFDINPYGLKIDFNVMPKYSYMDIIEPIVFMLGRHLSFILQTECIVMFENMRTPIGLFANGILSETFKRYNDIFFVNKMWRPNKI
jgi:hypothetical protein